MDTALHPASSVSPPIRWSMYAGLYMFACATAVALLMYDMLVLLAEAIGLPTAYAMFAFVLASPALVIGAIAWWALVERRASYTYRIGGAVGLLTALLTGLLWTARFASGWGLEMVLAIRILVGFVLGVVVAVGVLTGLPLMYARRRLNGEPSDGNGRAI